MIHRIAVLGANGFVGRETCRLLLESGFEVVGVIRREEARRELPGGIAVALVPTFSASGLAPALLRSDAVVHLVAKTHDVSNAGARAWSEHAAVNVGVTDAVLSAMQSAGVSRLVYLSSIKAVGDSGSRERPLSPTMPPRPSGAYGWTKWLAERMIQSRLVAQPGLRAVVLRSPLVYGPGVKGNMELLARAARTGLPLPLGGLGNSRSVISVANLASAIATVLERDCQPADIYHVSDGPPVSTTELYQWLREAAGRNGRVIPAWPAAMRLAAWLVGRRGTAARLLDDLVVDDTAFRDAFGWSPSSATADGVRGMIRKAPMGGLP